jgi:hypothetical protein
MNNERMRKEGEILRREKENKTKREWKKWKIRVELSDNGTKGEGSQRYYVILT